MEEKLFEKSYLGIKRVLRKAYESRYYKMLLDEANINPNEEFTYDDFKRIRITTKNEYNENKFDMLTNSISNFSEKEYQNIEGAYEKDLYLEESGLLLKNTSGSTGQPLDVLKSIKDMNKDYLSLNIQRKRLTDYDFSGKFLWIWPVNPYTLKYFNVNCDVNEAREVNKYGYQFFLYEHSDENMYKLYRAIIENNCEWMTSSPSVLFKLAKYIEKSGLESLKLRYIECHSEKLYDWQKEKITTVFGVIPVSMYSSNEIQFMGAVCENGKLHMFSNTCFVEFIDSRKEGAKEICVTSLNYMDVPVIRYKLGDCGDWDMDENCNCRLHKYPAIKLSGFRTNDFLVTKSGTLMEPFVITDSIYYLSCSLKLEIKQYKVIERDYDQFDYYLSRTLIEEKKASIEEYVKKYLEYVLKYPVMVNVRPFEEEISLASGMKYRYFEVKLYDAK